jgi:hypothetical protein
MKKVFAAISLIAMLMLFVSSSMAHDGAHDEGKEGHGMYEEGSGGSAMEMGRNSRAKAHEYKEEHGGDHSKEHYEKKYGKYEHEKNHMKEEGSSMKDEAMKVKEMEQKRMNEGSKM